MSMYNQHRGLGPAPGNARLNELLDNVRAEFDNQARAGGEYEHSSTWSIERYATTI
jgi:glucose repression regulatory protein TUP1